jgi:hypothetical protein
MLRVAAYIYAIENIWDSRPGVHPGAMNWTSGLQTRMLMKCYAEARNLANYEATIKLTNSLDNRENR